MRHLGAVSDAVGVLLLAGEPFPVGLQVRNHGLLAVVAHGPRHGEVRGCARREVEYIDCITQGCHIAQPLTPGITFHLIVRYHSICLI